jgi:hypothetical protein
MGAEKQQSRGKLVPTQATGEGLEVPASGPSCFAAAFCTLLLSFWCLCCETSPVFLAFHRSSEI